uniref:Uncharacterized protein n=1 Tax=Arabidopsis thaliana TaxID=3702 RepID=Q9LTN5_ARATH|nr:unnamed protein product [Arabidopsis thaliana]
MSEPLIPEIRDPVPSPCNSLLLLDLILDHPVVWQQTLESSIPVTFYVCYSTCHSTTPCVELHRAVLVECFLVST